MGVTGWVILAIVNIPLYILIGRVFFKDWNDFGEAVVFWIKPDLLSAFQGEFWDDWWAELKLGIFIGLSGFIVWAEGTYLAIPHIVPMFQ